MRIYKELADGGLKTYAPFSADPKPFDHVHLDPGPKKKAVAEKIYSQQGGLHLLVGIVGDQLCQLGAGCPYQSELHGH